MKAAPSSREGWRDYYIGVFNKTGRETAAHMAVWYMLLIEGVGP